jgi:hypothetical protein
MAKRNPQHYTATFKRRVKTIEIEMYEDGRMDRKNAAKYLGVTVHTLADFAWKKKGPKFYRSGNVKGATTFYYQSDLDEWIRGEE